MCISHFSSCGMGAKDSLTSRRRFIQRFLSLSPFSVYSAGCTDYRAKRVKQTPHSSTDNSSSNGKFCFG